MIRIIWICQSSLLKPKVLCRLIQHSVSSSHKRHWLRVARYPSPPKNYLLCALFCSVCWCPSLRRNQCCCCWHSYIHGIFHALSGCPIFIEAAKSISQVGAESEETFAVAEVLLKNMGAKVAGIYYPTFNIVMFAQITHCGGVGTGGAVKICNNLLLAISMIGTSEAMNLGIK